MKTIGLIPSQQLVSLQQDDDGNWIDVPEDETVVPLVKLPQPETAATQKAEPVLVWHEDRVERDWEIIDKTPEEIAAETARLYPNAPMWQVKVWMVRNGIDLASIPGIMAASIPAGPQLQEAIVRWETAPLVPYDNALVGLIASALNISKELAWSEIRAI